MQVTKSAERLSKVKVKEVNEDKKLNEEIGTKIKKLIKLNEIVLEHNMIPCNKPLLRKQYEVKKKLRSKNPLTLSIKLLGNETKKQLINKKSKRNSISPSINSEKNSNVSISKDLLMMYKRIIGESIVRDKNKPLLQKLVPKEFNSNTRNYRQRIISTELPNIKKEVARDNRKSVVLSKYNKLFNTRNKHSIDITNVNLGTELNNSSYLN